MYVDPKIPTRHRAYSAIHEFQKPKAGFTTPQTVLFAAISIATVIAINIPILAVDPLGEGEFSAHAEEIDGLEGTLSQNVLKRNHFSSDVLPTSKYGENKVDLVQDPRTSRNHFSVEVPDTDSDSYSMFEEMNMPHNNLGKR